MERPAFIQMLKRHGFRFAFRTDDGIWHGTDFLFPGDGIGKVVDGIPQGAPLCANRCCDCYFTARD